MARKRTWREKLEDSKDFPKVCEASAKKFGVTGTFVIPAPLEVDALMRQIRRGRLTTIADIRQCLAQKHSTTTACPITTGIFAWIAAHAADEEERAGKKRINPYWRTLKTGGELNLKYPGGLKNLVARLKAEGHRVIQRGKRYFVINHEQAIQRL